MNRIKLLGKSSSINVRKVLWLCAELQLAHDHEAWASGSRSTDVPEFLALNPNGMVPVIVDGDFVLWESNTICRYLATRERRHDLLPMEAKARARVEQWMDWQATELNNAWRYAFMALVRRHPAYADEAQVLASLAEWARQLGVLEAQLAHTGAFVTGPVFTLADVVLGLSVHRWFSTPGDKPALPAVAAYYERLTERPAFRAHGRNGQP